MKFRDQLMSGCLVMAQLASCAQQRNMSQTENDLRVRAQFTPAPELAKSLAEGHLSPEVIESYVNFRVYRYLFFRKSSGAISENDWEFFSYLDESEQQYGPPEHRLEVEGDYYWFVNHLLAGRGSDLSWYADCWYSLRTGEAKRVLWANDYGEYAYPNSFVISDHWRVVRHSLVNGVYRVTFDCDFAWKTNDDSSTVLFTRNNQMTYVWAPRLNKFLFDRSRSTATEEELQQVYPEYDVGFKKSLRLYINELENLARNGDRKQKNWLKDYLQYVGDDPYKKRLLRALRN